MVDFRLDEGIMF